MITPLVPIIDIQTLHLRVEKLVKTDDLHYREAIILICKELEIDPEDIAKIITGPLKEKLLVEAQSLNIVRRTNTARLY